MPNFGEINDYDFGTLPALLALDLSLCESVSITPETTMRRLLPADAKGDAKADDTINGYRPARYDFALNLQPQEIQIYQSHVNPKFAQLYPPLTATIKDECAKITQKSEEITKSNADFSQAIIATGVPDRDKYQAIDTLHAERSMHFTTWHKKQLLETNIKDCQLDCNKPTLENEVFKVCYKHNIANSSEVPRFGINAKKFSTLCGRYSPSDILLPVEFHALHAGIQYLIDKEAADGSSVSSSSAAAAGAGSVPVGYKNNVALCDIFVKDDSGDGVIIRKGKICPECHTVALWKVSDSKIILIDPNNHEYSKLITHYGQVIISNIEIESAPDYLAPHKLYETFYQPGKGDDKTGRVDIKSRDCIDIAVKIGFGLNELQMSSIDTKQILRNLHYNMSNEGEDDKKDKQKAAQILKRILRPAQSSSAVERESFVIFNQGLAKYKSALNTNGADFTRVMKS